MKKILTGMTVRLFLVWCLLLGVEGVKVIPEPDLYTIYGRQLFEKVFFSLFNDLPKPEEKAPLGCTACLFVFRRIHSMISSNASDETIITKATDLCSTFSPEYVCKGLIIDHLQTVKYVLKNSKSGVVPQGKSVCAALLNKPCDSALPGAINGEEWQIDLEKYARTKQKSNHNSRASRETRGVPDLPRNSHQKTENMQSLNWTKEKANTLSLSMAQSNSTDPMGVLQQSKQLVGKFPNVTSQRGNLPKISTMQSPHGALPDKTVMKILHLTDIHLDLNYKVGAMVGCEAPLCCQKDSKGTSNVTAGEWGSYGKCGLPMKTFLHMLNHIKNTHKDIDYIFWTGDAPPHKIWDETKDDVLKHYRVLAKEINRFFPDIPKQHSVGNHEASPVNLFVPDEIKGKQFDIKWLYKTLEKEWVVWTDESITKTVYKGGFYAYPIFPGLKLISVNTNQCQSLNWWNFLEPKDIDDQLSWLADELYKAEVDNEKVYILGHIPPGDHVCMKTWSHQYNRIIERFQDTIQAQFYGHTHRDEINVFYNSIRKPFSTGFVTPSITSYPDLNPSYRIFDIDLREKTRYEVLDYHTYFGDIGQANLEGLMKWQLSYSMKDTYNLSDLSVKSLDELAKKILTDDKYFNVYRENYEKKSPGWESCDTACEDRVKCGIVLTDRATHPDCNKFMQQLRAQIANDNHRNSTNV